MIENSFLYLLAHGVEALGSESEVPVIYSAPMQMMTGLSIEWSLW